ncbi:hypothetical protein JCM8208_001396 [Rhodotorula glutinis]
MPPALQRLQAALAAFYHPRNSDSGQRYRGQLFLWKKIGDRLLQDYAPHWSDDDIASIVRELAAYTAFLTRTKPQRVAKLGEPSAAQHLPTLNRLYNEANSTPEHVPFRIQISLDQLKTAWDAVGAPQHELESWLGHVEAFMSEEASSMSPAQVLAVANELATYAFALQSGMDTEDFNFDEGLTLPPLGTARAATHLPTLSLLFMEDRRPQSGQARRSSRSASPDDEEHPVPRRSPVRREHEQRSLARSMLGHPHYKLERLRPF